MWPAGRPEQAVFGKATYSTKRNQGWLRTAGENTRVSVLARSGLHPAGEGHVDHPHNPLPQARRDPQSHTMGELHLLVIPELDHNFFIF